MRRSLYRCDRGAMFVEALVVIPLLVTLWIILLFLEQGNTVANETVERSRQCAWRRLGRHGRLRYALAVGHS